jgi:hypothetical protein
MEDDEDGPVNYIIILKDNRLKIRPVMFISKLFIDAESRYWFTEFDIACIIWIVWKIRQFFEGSVYEIVIYINHLSVIDIAK